MQVGHIAPEAYLKCSKHLVYIKHLSILIQGFTISVPALTLPIPRQLLLKIGKISCKFFF